ncbi:MAG TPA: hypothetical protein VLA71_01050, partial [Algoriphagus sp.]|nr:hypothetical protein [Algoriphagus sp.]
MKRSFSFFAIAAFLLGLWGCEQKTKVAAISQTASFTSFSDPVQQDEEDEIVGVYFMPSWNTSPDPAVDRDSFWSCLQDPANCSSLQNPGIWGPKGRIYNAKYPYEGPYLNRKPISELKGFYSRTDAEVAKKQLQYMKSYGIDFF